MCRLCGLGCTSLKKGVNIGAGTIRIGFGGIVYYNYNKEPPKSGRPRHYGFDVVSLLKEPEGWCASSWASFCDSVRKAENHAFIFC